MIYLKYTTQCVVHTICLLFANDLTEKHIGTQAHTST